MKLYSSLHRQLQPYGHTLVMSAALLFAGLHASKPVHGQVVWLNDGSLGGFFNDGSNWVGGEPPTAADSILFSNLSNTAVSFAAPRSVSDARIINSVVSFGSSGSIARGLTLNTSFNDAIVVTDGLLSLTDSTRFNLRATRGIRLINSSLNVARGGDVLVGGSVFGDRDNPATGATTVRVSEGGTLNTSSGQTTELYDAAMTIQDAGSTWTAGAARFAGNRNLIRVESGGQMTLASLSFGDATSEAAASTSSMVIAGAGTSVDVSGFVSVATSDKSVSVTDLATLDVGGNFSLGVGPAAVAAIDRTSMTVRNATVTIGQRLSVGSGRGTASMFIQEGAALDTNSAVVGAADVEGSFVSLNDSTWTNVGSINLGRESFLGTSTGNGSLIANGGSKIFTDSLVLAGGGISITDSTLTTRELSIEGGYVALNRSRIEVTGPDSLVDFSRRSTGDLRLDGTASLDVAGKVIFGGPGETVIETSSNFSASAVENRGTLTVINAADFGSASRHDGYSGGGRLHVGDSNVVLRDAGLAELGQLTTIDSGRITADNGVSLSAGGVLVGSGRVEGRFTGSVGSLISAEDSLTIGDSGSVVGFVHAGELRTGNSTVNLLDRNAAELGSLTHLGDQQLGEGTLKAASGIVMEFGDNLTGHGTVTVGDTIGDGLLQNGSVIGESLDAAITIEGYVRGIGTFENVVFDGTFDPGLSPTLVRGTNLRFDNDSLLRIELGGNVRGDQYDAFDIEGALQLGGSLDVSLIDEFSLGFGQEFLIADVEGSMTGMFSGLGEGSLVGNYGGQDLFITYNGFSGNAGVGLFTAVPEPGSGAMLLVLTAGLCCRRVNSRRG